MDKLNVNELKMLAKEQGLRGYSLMKKPELMNLLHNKPMLKPFPKPMNNMNVEAGAMLENSNLGGGIRHGDRTADLDEMDVNALRYYIKGHVRRADVNKMPKSELVKVAEKPYTAPLRPKKQPNIWIQAVVKYNKDANLDNYTVPREGTEAHAAVVKVASQILGRPYEPKSKKKAKVVVVEPVKPVKPVKKTKKPKVKA